MWEYTVQANFFREIRGLSIICPRGAKSWSWINDHWVSNFPLLSIFQTFKLADLSYVHAVSGTQQIIINIFMQLQLNLVQISLKIVKNLRGKYYLSVLNFKSSTAMVEL